jgi:hypothetical protein
LVSWALVGCGQPATDAPQEASGADAQQKPAADPTDDWPTADQILLAHNRATNQCKLLEAENYKLQWAATTKDGHTNPTVEQIVHQGKPGYSFTRIHQRREPNVRFAAFGRTNDGKFWSASDGGVQPDLPEEVGASLAVGMNPTPACEYEKRWPRRELVGPEDREGTPTWHVELGWVDGTTSHMWFHRDRHVLVAAESSAGDTKTTTEMRDYFDFHGVIWPKAEVATRQEGPIAIQTVQQLENLAVDQDPFVDIGPKQVSAILAKAAAE